MKKLYGLCLIASLVLMVSPTIKALQNVTAAEFDNLIATNAKVVVDFYADWCGPCQRLKPILNDIAIQYPDIKFVAVNTDTEKALSTKYSIRGLPTVLFFKDGCKVDQMVGFNSKPKIINKIKTVFG